MRSLHYLLSSLSVVAVTRALANPLIIPRHESSLAVRHAATDDFDDILPELGIRAAKKPFYAIAHRCNDMSAVQRAVNDGANAIEMDIFSEGKDGWWASHDGPSKNGDRAKDMFDNIAAHRKAGKPITFVWLDLKNPDACDPGKPEEWGCSIAALRDLARQILEPQGVRVLYGFYGNENGNAYRLLQSGLTANEAMNVDGRSAPLQQSFNNKGPSSIQKRVASYGWKDLKEGFGDCTESGDAHLTCTQLRQEVASGKFGKVFSWTAVVDQVQLVQKLMGVGIDGIIYGLDGAPYGGSATQALAQIRSALAQNGGYRYAGVSDNPW
ncbi:phospholipase D [Fusarium tjaetaba]|uniref:Phospholipase D n=1 Tax=Fusarium tjaetaba TaxID=1567544 RepID=A0A8H5VCJ5_9HYPO|nr:phospholipase D [Fusarium tjaetaba]KAF5617045.1 phospholipase D [Fusarium tjaetaba]